MNPFGEIAIIGILCLCFCAIGYFAGRYDVNKNICQEKSGIYVQSPNGWLCMKGEKL